MTERHNGVIVESSQSSSNLGLAALRRSLLESKLALSLHSPCTPAHPSIYPEIIATSSSKTNANAIARWTTQNWEADRLVGSPSGILEDKTNRYTPLASHRSGTTMNGTMQFSQNPIIVSPWLNYRKKLPAVASVRYH